MWLPLATPPLAALRPTLMGVKCLWEFFIMGGLKPLGPTMAQKGVDNITVSGKVLLPARGRDKTKIGRN